MNTRKVSYIELNEDYLQKEVDWAVKTSFEERFRVFCNHLHTVYSLARIDITTYPLKRVIYNMPDNEN